MQNGEGEALSAMQLQARAAGLGCRCRPGAVTLPALARVARRPGPGSLSPCSLTASGTTNVTDENMDLITEQHLKGRRGRRGAGLLSQPAPATELFSGLPGIRPAGPQRGTAGICSRCPAA